MVKDFLGLKKLERDLKISNKAFDIFPNDKRSKKKNKKNLSKKIRYDEKFLSKKDVEAIRSGVKYTKDTIRILHKLATKNKIPNNLEEALSMKDRLIKEENEYTKLVLTKKQIKDVQKLIKERKKQELRNKIDKFKSKFRIHKEQCSNCGKDVKVWGDLKNKLCIECDENGLDV